MGFYRHPNSIIESEKIGGKTRIWAFAHILPGAKIGQDCNVCDHVFIENDVVVGDRVTIKCGVQLWDGLRVEDDVFIGPNVTFTNNPFPRSKKYPERTTETYIKKGASIGANATILPGITIGANAMIGAGSVVTRDVPANAIVIGNPGYISGYVSPSSSRKTAKAQGPIAGASCGVMDSEVSGVKIYHLPVITDLRGSLSFAEYGQYLPFIPKRYFLVFGVASKEIRGEHAHKTLQQYLVCIHGSCSLIVDDTKNSQEILLDRLNIGVYLPPMVWAVQYRYTADTVLMVLASDVYDAKDYIRDFDAYREAKTRK